VSASSRRMTTDLKALASLGSLHKTRIHFERETGMCSDIAGLACVRSRVFSGATRLSEADVFLSDIRNDCHSSRLCIAR